MDTIHITFAAALADASKIESALDLSTQIVKGATICYTLDEAAKRELDILQGLKVPIYGQYQSNGPAETGSHVFATDGEHWVECPAWDKETPAVPVPPSGRVDTKLARTYWTLRIRTERRIRRRNKRKGARNAPGQLLGKSVGTTERASSN